ncbi:MAG: hypothetical protein JNM69_42060 [Archangium sp.]|nr:hypothetical protein [Archangium sp.]
MDDAEFSSINITPLVDIVLVLLIAALTGATIVTHHALAFDAPGGGGEGQVLVLDVGRDGFRLDGVLVEGDVLAALTRARATGAEALLLRVEPTLDLAVAVRAADVATTAGFHRLGMISRPPAMTPR